MARSAKLLAPGERRWQGEGMARRDRAVERALNRWTAKGLVDEQQARVLRDEAQEAFDLFAEVSEGKLY